MRIPGRFDRSCEQWAACVTVLALLSGGCGPPAGSTAPPAAEVTPEAVLTDMVQAYRQAEAYSDRGVLSLRYTQNGTFFHDEAPLAIAFEGTNKIRLHAYQATLVCDGNQLMAHVAHPDEDELDRQVLLVPAPTELSLPSLLADPVLKAALTGGAGRLPIQLELLLAESPLEAILPAEVEKRLVRATRVEGRPCHGVEVKTDEGRFVFWVDQETSILRRLEYPGEVVPAGLGAVKPVLVAEFRQARFASTGASETYFVSLTNDQRSVSEFVLPPPPLPSPLLGKQVDNFHFLNPNGPQATAKSLTGKVTVLLWFSDHVTCQTALQQLQQVRQLVEPADVEMLAVCTEPSDRSHQDLAELMRKWDVQIPLRRDLRAFGRDLFAIPGAPALVVLDTNRVVQVYQVGLNPYLVEELPGVLQRLVQGEDLAAAARAQYESEMAAFRAAVQD